jgi:hypothetical protein
MTNKNIDSNRESSKEHAQERVSNYSDREIRATNRDMETVKLPDGREFIRNPRSHLKRHGALSDLPKKAGFIRRWVSGNIPNRLQDLIDLGYKPATNENGLEIAPIRGGQNKMGETFMRYAMEISEEMNEKIQRDNQIKINNRQQESIDKLAGKDLGMGSMTYVAQDQKKLIK